jgi:hypothetical protein
MDNTTIKLRRILGILGMIMPFLVIIFGLITKQPSSYFISISATHYTAQYLLFEGLVVAVGLFLICYNGYDIKDNILSTIAGIGAIMLCYLPAKVEGTTTWNFLMLSENITDVFHIIGGLAFFGMLFWIIEFQFTKTSEFTEQKLKRNVLYKICGWMICFGIIFGGAMWFFGSGIMKYAMMIGEIIALEAFGVAWFVKGKTLLQDK